MITDEFVSITVYPLTDVNDTAVTFDLLRIALNTHPYETMMQQAVDRPYEPNKLLGLDRPTDSDQLQPFF